MAKKPASSKKPPTASNSPSPDPIEEIEEARIEAPLSAKDHLFNIAKSLAAVKGFTPHDAELYALVEEQFIHPHLRTINRFNRKADESLCQALESDVRFKEALQLAKGDVF